jgi:hypothetical protein
MAIENRWGPMYSDFLLMFMIHPQYNIFLASSNVPTNSRGRSQLHYDSPSVEPDNMPLGD